MDILTQFNLPKYVKDKSFSEASALIAKQFEDRNSPEDIATLNDLQGRLQQAQEFVKAEQERRTNPQVAAESSMPLGMEGAAGMPMPEQASSPSGQLANQFNEGDGITFMKPNAGKGVGASGYMAMAGTAMELGTEAFGKTGIDTSGAVAPPDVPSKGSAIANGAMKGASAGAMLGPWGAAGGAVIGGALSAMGNAKAQQEANDADIAYTGNLQNKATNSYEYGGGMKKSGASKLANMYNHGGPHTQEDPFVGYESWMGDHDGTGGYSGNIPMPKINTYEPAEISAVNTGTPGLAPTRRTVNTDVNSVDSAEKPKAKFNPTELLRYAPAAMNAVQLAGLKKPQSIGTDRLGNKYNEQRVDERGLQNTVQEGVANNRNAILNAGAGDASGTRASLLANSLQGLKAQSGAYQAAGAENRQEARTAQNFNLDVDKTNLSQSNLATNLNLEQSAAYDTNKSKLMAQLGDDLGGVGTEELFKRFPELAGLGYDWKGRKIKNKGTVS